MQEIKRISKRSGGDLFEIRHPHHLLANLEKHKKTWGLLLETPLGLYNPNYHVDLKKGGTQKNRLNKDGSPDKFNVQIAKIVGLTNTEFPSEVLSVGVELRPNQAMTHIIARIRSIETNEGIVEFDFPFTPNCLTFTDEFKSRIWFHHLRNLRDRDPFIFLQAAKKIDSFCKEVRKYKNAVRSNQKVEEIRLQETLENNLLLLSRYWEWLGLDMGLHVTRFPDQPYATITFAGHGRIQRGIELKYDSNGYTRSKYKSKAGGREMVILCFEHNDHKLLKGEDYLDVVDASELGKFMMSELGKVDSQETNG